VEDIMPEKALVLRSAGGFVGSTSKYLMAEHPVNALAPMLVTPLGIVMVCRDEHV
jgi:hypothetical protein